MIRHLVFWKLKDAALGKSRAENAAAIKERLEGLADVIPEIRHIEVSLNVLDGSSEPFDVALYSEFASEEDLATYQEHPEHKRVSEFVGQLREERLAVDFESPGRAPA